MGVRVEVWPFVGLAWVLGAALYGVCQWLNAPAPLTHTLAGGLPLVLSLYFLYFFRDPPRTAPADPDAIVSGADGVIANIVELDPARFRACADFAGLKDAPLQRFMTGDTVRISIFLSLVDVHVNRAPIAGQSTFLGYFPGKHFFTFEEKSSDHNQHNSILIENERTICLFNQIVGPVARRVVYWPDHTRAVPVTKGAPIGMMKFGSRLDLYFPKRDIALTIKPGDRVRAGETVIARLVKEAAQ